MLPTCTENRGAHMKKIVFCLLLLTFSFRLAAQIDYLEPVKPFSSYTGELGEYYRSVFSLLNTGFQKQPYARFAAIPSFSPEYAMSVEKKNGRYTLVSNTLSRTYWQAEKGTVTVDTKSVVISASLYQSLGCYLSYGDESGTGFGRFYGRFGRSCLLFLFYGCKR